MVKMDDLLLLELVSEKNLPQTANGHLIKYCPSMDLVALGSTDQQVLIYRLNGQRVYGATQRGGNLRVESLCWKPNGQLLAIAWGDGSVRLVGADSSKIVHQFSTGDSVTGVTCMGWASNLTYRTPSAEIPKVFKSWEAVFVEGGDYADTKTNLDLPRDLSLIDIEISLPKLSVLSAGGSSDEVFSSRASLDPLFRPFDPKDNDAVDVMVVGTAEGEVYINIYDSFVVGSFKCPVMDGHASHLMLHASHPEYSTHSLVMKSSRPNDYLYFVPMDLRFVSASSEYLSILASRSTALQNLLRYIHQVQSHMAIEWKATQELPSRFLRNINETLEENNSGNIIQALYHSVATGHTFPAVKDWLVDELAERGHKRWDKAVVTGLENLRRLVHENMLPALDRCTVILSRFMGIAKFQDTKDTFSAHQISLIMDNVACLHLVTSKILIQVVDELDLFKAFSAWVRFEIDRLASDASGSSAEELNDKEEAIDHSKVLLYLQTSMTSSPLAVFFGDAVDIKSRNYFDSGSPLYPTLDSEIQKQERGLPYNEMLPRIEPLCDYLTRQANSVFKQIAEAEKRNVLFGKPCELGVVEEGDPIDIRMSKVDEFICQCFITSIRDRDPPKSTVQIYRITLNIDNGISNVSEIATTMVELGNGHVKDIKFVSDSTMLVLWENKGLTHLLSIAYHDLDDDDHMVGRGLLYVPYDHKTAAITPKAFSCQQVLTHLARYKITCDKSFVPAKLEVREQALTGSIEDMRRIVVMSEDRLHYKVYKLPGQAKRDSDEDTQMS